MYCTVRWASSHRQCGLRIWKSLTCGFLRYASRQTDIYADHNTLHPIKGEVTMPTKRTLGMRKCLWRVWTAVMRYSFRYAGWRLLKFYLLSSLMLYLQTAEFMTIQASLWCGLLDMCSLHELMLSCYSFEENFNRDIIMCYLYLTCVATSPQ